MFKGEKDSGSEAFGGVL